MHQVPWKARTGLPAIASELAPGRARHRSVTQLRFLALWSSRSARHPVKVEVAGSSPVKVAQTSAPFNSAGKPPAVQVRVSHVGGGGAGVVTPDVVTPRALCAGSSRRLRLLITAARTTGSGLAASLHTDLVSPLSGTVPPT